LEKRISFQFCSPADEVGETFTLSVLCWGIPEVVLAVAIPWGQTESQQQQAKRISDMLNPFES